MTAAHVAKWGIVAMLTMGALVTIACVGKPRAPTTPGVAAVSTMVTALMVVLIVLWWPS